MPDSRFAFPDCKDSFEPTTVQPSVGMGEKLSDSVEKQDGGQDFFWKCQPPLPTNLQPFVDLFG